jgi:hypothetical protein
MTIETRVQFSVNEAIYFGVIHRRGWRSKQFLDI